MTNPRPTRCSAHAQRRCSLAPSRQRSAVARAPGLPPPPAQCLWAASRSPSCLPSCVSRSSRGESVDMQTVSSAARSIHRCSSRLQWAENPDVNTTWQHHFCLAVHAVLHHHLAVGRLAEGERERSRPRPGRGRQAPPAQNPSLPSLMASTPPSLPPLDTNRRLPTRSAAFHAPNAVRQDADRKVCPTRRWTRRASDTAPLATISLSAATRRPSASARLGISVSRLGGVCSAQLLVDNVCRDSRRTAIFFLALNFAVGEWSASM